MRGRSYGARSRERRRFRLDRESPLVSMRLTDLGASRAKQSGFSGVLHEDRADWLTQAVHGRSAHGRASIEDVIEEVMSGDLCLERGMRLVIWEQEPDGRKSRIVVEMEVR